VTSPLPPMPTLDAFALGDEVLVHAFACWRPGKIVAFTQTGLARVEYSTGTGVARVTNVRKSKLLPPCALQPTQLHVRMDYNAAMIFAADFWGGNL
jgi:hypothetical protein